MVGGEDYPNIPPISFFKVGNRKMGAKKQSLRNGRYNLNECKIILKILIHLLSFEGRLWVYGPVRLFGRITKCVDFYVRKRNLIHKNTTGVFGFVPNWIIHLPPTTILDEYPLESVRPSRHHSRRDVGTVFSVVR